MPRTANRMTAADVNNPKPAREVVGLGLERVRKITADRVVGELSPMSPDEPTRWLFDLYGLITEVKVEPGTYGHYNRWVGEFRTVHIEDGSILESANLILPPIADDLAVVEWKKQGKTGGNVLLALRLGVMPPPPPKPGREPSEAGYVYTCRNINPHAGASPLDMLYAAANPDPDTRNKTPAPPRPEADDGASAA